MEACATLPILKNSVRIADARNSSCAVAFNRNGYFLLIWFLYRSNQNWKNSLLGTGDEHQVKQGDPLIICWIKHSPTKVKYEPMISQSTIAFQHNEMCIRISLYSSTTLEHTLPVTSNCTASYCILLNDIQKVFLTSKGSYVSRIIQHSLCCGSLPCINVGHNANVTDSA